MMAVLNTDEMRRAEAAANESGLDYARMMENAGSAAARVIRQHYPVAGQTVMILCGSGNNGGDGFVIARKLLEQNAKVGIILTGDMPRTAIAMEMAQRLRHLPIPVYRWMQDPQAAVQALQSTRLVVDAVFGIGFRKVLPDSLRGLFRLIHDRRIPVVAVDIPSGMNADDGHCDPDTLRAALTVTFTALKPALTMPEAAPVYGRVEVADIGMPPEIWQAYAGTPTVIDSKMVQACFSPRPEDSHKGTFGHVLAVCGSYGMAGAATLSVRGALRCGAGLVTAAIPRSIYPMVTVAQPEAVCLPLPDNDEGQRRPEARERLYPALAKATALLVGCGLGQGEEATALVLDLLERATCPMVLDADGINAVCAHIDKLKAHEAPLILTPHPGEAGRLLGCSVAQIQTDRPAAAQELAERYGCVAVLKGSGTLIAAPGREMLHNPTGNPGLARGGSGDVLAGMIAALLGQKHLQGPHATVSETTALAVWLHGKAGDKCAQRFGEYAMLPSDLIGMLPEVLKENEERK